MPLLGARAYPRIKWTARALLVVVALVVAAGAFTARAPDWLPWDKAEHTAGFYALAVLSAVAFPTTRLRWIALSLMLLGFAGEACQGLLIPGRQADWMDAVANLLGVAVAFVGEATGQYRRLLATPLVPRTGD